jgi:hypothetical protein
MRKLEHLFQLVKCAYWRHCAAMAQADFPSEMVAGKDRTAHDIKRILFHNSDLEADTFLRRSGVAFGTFISGEVWSKVTGRRRYNAFSSEAAPYELRDRAAAVFRRLDLADEKFREYLGGLAGKNTWEAFFAGAAKYYFLKAGVCDCYSANPGSLKERLGWLSSLPRFLRKPDDAAWRNFRAYLYGCFALAYDPVPALCSFSPDIPDEIETRLREFAGVAPEKLLQDRNQIHRTLGALGCVIGYRVAKDKSTTLYWERLLVKYRFSWFVSAMSGFEDGPAFARRSGDLDLAETLKSIATSDWTAGYREVMRGGIRRFFEIAAEPLSEASPWPVTVEEWRARSDEVLRIINAAEERLNESYKKHTR